jgi:Ca-activated chloride channel family protein
MMRKLLATLVVLGATVLAGPGVARADGLIVPVDPEMRVRGHWSVRYHHVDIVVRDQVASVSIDQEFLNTGGGLLEVEYIFPVPPEAAIDSMTLVVDGKEYPARLLKADEARKTYEEIVRKKKDPALLEYAGYGLYRTRAFPLEAGKPARVQVHYQGLCRRDGDLVQVWYPLNTEKYSARPIESVRVRVDIEANQDILSVYSPTHTVKEDRQGPRHVVITYDEKNVLPADDLSVFYRLSDKDVGADLITWQPDRDTDGFFMLLVSPNPGVGQQAVVAKDVVVVLDRSGSMGGDKIAQARTSARYILDNLNADDRFSVIAYNDNVEALFDKLVSADPAHLDEARGQVDRINSRGGTNIHDALREAMQMVSAAGGRDGRPAYVIFLTDGLPTVGKTDEKDILSATREANKANARLFAFGVGYDVNVRLLDKLVGQNNGRSDYVKPNEPIEGKISSLYAKIRNPVMTHLKLDMGGLRPRMAYPRELGDLFEGDQIVVVGRYDAKARAELGSGEDGSARTAISLSGQWQGSERSFEYPVRVNAPGQAKQYKFIEPLWAMRRIGYLLDQVQLNGESKEIIDELISLSTQYGIVTPYTSFLADESVALGKPASVAERVGRDVKGLRQQTGGMGQLGAMNRQSYNQAIAVPAANAPAGHFAMTGAADVDSYEAGRQTTVQTVQMVEGHPLYRRGNVWATADAAKLDLDKDRDQIKEIDRFSTEYFELVGANSLLENQMLSRQAPGEQLLIRLRGQVYLIR